MQRLDQSKVQLRLGEEMTVEKATQTPGMHFFALTHVVPRSEVAGAGSVMLYCAELGPIADKEADDNDDSTLSPFDYCEAWKPFAKVVVSESGMSEFLSCLYVLSSRASANSLCAHLLTRIFPPAAGVLFRLLKHRSHLFSSVEKRLVATELYLLFRQMLPEKIADSAVFESSRLCFAELLSDAAEAKPFQTIPILCPRTLKRIEDPVKLSDGSIVSKSELKEEDVMNSGADLNDLCLFLKSESGLAAFYRIKPSFSLAPEPSIRVVSKKPLVLFKDSCLRLIPPLSLKSGKIPSLTRSFATHVVVCSSRGGGCGDADAAASIQLWDPKTGKETGVDPHALATSLSDRGIDLGSTDDRIPEELIFVAIDVSRSMRSPAFTESDGGEKESFIDTPDAEATSAISDEDLVAQIADMREFSVLEARLRRADPIGWRCASYLAFDHQDAILADRFKSLSALLPGSVEPTATAKSDDSLLPSCSITGEPFVDPVTTADGQTYERSAISEWFSRGNRSSPATGLLLSELTLTPNYGLKAAMTTLKAMSAKLAAESGIPPQEAVVETRTLSVRLFRSTDTSKQLLAYSPPTRFQGEFYVNYSYIIRTNHPFPSSICGECWSQAD